MTIAAILLAVWMILAKTPFRYPFDKHGWGLILSFAAGFLLQTYGLQFTSAARSGFITSLYVIVVPFVVLKIAHEKPRFSTVFAIPLALAGTALLMNPFAEAGWNLGDLLTLACALAFGFQIVWTSRLGRNVHPVTMMFWPALFTGLINFLLLPIQWERLQATQFIAPFWWGLAYSVLGGSIVAIYIMNRFQPKTDAVTASVIYTIEPVFAAIFAVIWFGETLTTTELIGGGIILFANLLAQVPWSMIRKQMKMIST